MDTARKMRLALPAEKRAAYPDGDDGRELEPRGHHD
jgi:hypothetical protein